MTPACIGEESDSMRQLGTVTDERAAQRFADYLLTKGIGVSLEPDHDGCRLWVRNEDHLEPARREFAAFTASPDAPVYQEAGRAAEQLRAEERRRAKEAKKNVVNVSGRWRGGMTRRLPLTILLMSASIVTAVVSNLGEKQSVVTQLSIVPYEIRGQFIHYALLSQIWYREPWRVVTPIFLHFGLLHIVFNMLMLLQLGALIEAARGSWRFAIFVLLIAVPSNVAQYLWSGPMFGGMSGVVYGLFGYIWMKSRYEPGSGFYVAPNTVIWMVGWFVMCLLQIIPGAVIANAVHTAGLVMGIILGRLPSLWRSLR
jgi:GlpG protein